MPGQKQEWLESRWALPTLAFAFAFLSGVLDVAYKSLDLVAHGYPHQLKIIILEEGTGRLGIAIILPLALLFLRRFPFRRNALARNIGLHLGISVILSVIETTFNSLSRTISS